MKTHIQPPNLEAGNLHALQWMGLSVRSSANLKYEETLDLGLVADQDGVGRRYFYFDNFDTGREIRVVASFQRAANGTPMTLEELAVHVVEHDQARFVARPATTDAFLGLPSAIGAGTAGDRHLSLRVFWHPTIERYVVIAALSKTDLATADLERQQWESTMELTPE